jgi:DNA processing protein
MNDEIRTRIALSLVPNIGANRARLLLNKVDRPQDIFKLSESDILKIPGIGKLSSKSLLSFNAWDEVDHIINKSERLNCRLIIPEEDIYPNLLKEIPDPPLLLWVKGSVDLLNNAGIAIVGTRSPSLYGKEVTKQFTSELVEYSVTIISGLAYGIDTVAHTTAVKTGGKTIAVLGSGIDRIYPSMNINLADKIIESGGAIISEFPPGTKPDYMNFPMRNRVVSGLSLGVLVVETANEGGSMITARLALDQNREVFVIPHNLSNKRASGCHKLLRESTGKLVETVEDITSEFGWIRFVNHTLEKKKRVSEIKPEGLNGDSQSCWEYLYSRGKVHADDIVNDLKIPAGKLMQILLELEFNDYILQSPGKYFEVNAIQ